MPCSLCHMQSWWQFRLLPSVSQFCHMAWCCVWYVLSKFRLPAKFAFAPLNAAPASVSCYHLSSTNISPCRAELEEVWLQSCWAGWNPGSCCQWSATPFNNRKGWWCGSWNCLRNPRAGKATSHYHCHVLQYFRPLTLFMDTWSFGLPTLYTLRLKSRQYIIWSDVENGLFFYIFTVKR